MAMLACWRGNPQKDFLRFRRRRKRSILCLKSKAFGRWCQKWKVINCAQLYHFSRITIDLFSRTGSGLWFRPVSSLANSFIGWRQLKSLCPLKCDAEQGKTKQIMGKRSDCSSGFPLCSCESGELRFVRRCFSVVCSGGFKKDLLWEANWSR